MFRHGMVSGLVFALVAVPLLAANGAKDAPKKAAAPAQPAGAAMKVTVKSVSGVAHKRLASDPKGRWVPVKAGDVLDETTLIRTGLGARVVLILADRGQVTIRSATKAGIGQFRKQGQLVKARLGLKYGSMRASVDGSRGANDFRVATPVATLSVRGTGGTFWFSGDFGFFHCSTWGDWLDEARNKKKRIQAGECTDGWLRLWILLALLRRANPAGDALGGLSNWELRNYLYNGRGQGGFDYIGTRPLTLLLFGLASVRNGESEPNNGYPNGYPERPSNGGNGCIHYPSGNEQ